MTLNVTSRQLPSGLHLLKYTDDSDDDKEWYYLQGPRGGWAYIISEEEYRALDSLCLERREDGDDEVPLRPCPFCGSKNVSSVSYLDRAGKRKFMIQCRKCGGGMTSYTTPFRAVGGWNRRAVPLDVDEPGQPVVTMASMLDMMEEDQ